MAWFDIRYVIFFAMLVHGMSEWYMPYEKNLYDFYPKNIQLNFCTTFVQFLCDLLQFLAHLLHGQIVQI